MNPTESPAPVPNDEIASSHAADQAALDRLLAGVGRIESELAKAIVGQQAVIEQLLIALLAGGHCLITGAPGLAKTLLVKSIARIFHLRFSRIQFTPDLMPTDITGTEILQETAGSRKLTFVRGPIFAHLVLADEINRTPPKTQAALLEAMQEHQVTAGGVRHALEEPFFVLATQNPVEMEGTYPLPEAQLDRFMFNVVMDYLPEEDEVEVVRRTTDAPQPLPEALFSGDDIRDFQRLVRQTPIATEWIRYAVRLASASRPRQAKSLDFINQWVNWGAGTRCGQYLVLGAKARALIRGRTHVTGDDIRAIANATLRHRVLLNYRADADGVRVDDVIRRIIEAVPPPLPNESE
jgi:MoxR-like ATPase